MSESGFVVVDVVLGADAVVGATVRGVGEESLHGVHASSC